MMIRVNKTNTASGLQVTGCNASECDRGIWSMVVIGHLL